MPSFSYILQQITIYYGIPVLAAGLVGGTLSSIVFLSLKTFRQSSCAFYLTVMSIVNIGQLLTGLLSRIMINGYGNDLTTTSEFYCKLRYFLLQFCTLLSLTSISLATIDQCFTTSLSPRWQRWSNLKIAHRLILLFTIVWALHGILYLVFFVQIYSPDLGKTTCSITDATFLVYHAYGYFLILSGFLPIGITILFALLAFHNIRRSMHQNVPIFHRELDKQLTMMVLVQVVVNALTLLPSNVLTAVQKDNSTISDPVVAARVQFAQNLSILWYYLNFTSPFYIYLCVSERFRRQFIYVIYDMHFNRYRRPQIVINQVVPTI
ncbi:unnamed protein product [Adineta ricciae]|uniref:G-protein coupled receptors family 1 profile domain-containing protein n=1 Tax=Adineta ricciae TaxID=249248 RepID=A0A815PKX7_ADIRI|nr:unnamed protein product [Adineta ricciae]